LRDKEALRDDSIIFINSLYVKPALLFLFAGLFGVLCYRGGGYLTFLNLTDQAFISDALCVRNLLETGGFMERGLLFFFLKT